MADRIASLSVVDHDILTLLHAHRVLTTPQVVALTGRPERTIDYRLARLRERSLAARTRPYAASGSAPYYWWLTRTGARLIEGTSPAPGKGEPNPLFLRHAAAIAGLYVAFREVGPDVGLTLTSWRRDEESWEDWGHLGRAGRIRPDAYAEVQLDAAGELGTAGAFIEVDFATMDQARLRAKVARHRRYAEETIWWERHPCCPALLLVTTSEARVSRFLAGVEKDRPKRNPYEKDRPTRYDELVAARASVASPEAAVASPVWRAGVGDAPSTLSALLAPEVRQYRHVVARVQAAWRAHDDALRRSAAWNLSREADAIATALGDTEAARAVRYLVGQESSVHRDWVDEHPDLADATFVWWREAKEHGAVAPAPLVDAWRAVGRTCWLEQAERFFALHEALALADPLLRRPAQALAAGELVADYELKREQPIDGRAAASDAMGEHERRREIAVSAEIQALPLHRRRLANRADLEVTYDARHLCVCPRCGVPRNDDEDLATSGYHGVRCQCCGGSVVPMAACPELPAELDDSIARIVNRRHRLRGAR